MYPGQTGALSLQCGQRRVLVIETHRLLALLPRSTSLGKQVIVQPATLLKLLLQEAHLLRIRVQAVLECFTYVGMLA
jgi:hypothetical protein